MKHPFYLLVFAVFLAVLCLFSGLDWIWAKWSEQWMWLQYIAIPSVFIGILMPVVLPIWLFLRGKKHVMDAFRAKAALYAFIATWGISTFMKAFTNRIPREPFEALGEVDFSAQFRFGFLQGANLWESLVEGFPSGHAMTAFAMSFALLPFIRRRELRLLVVWYALYIGWGVTMTVHWLSDALAGGIIGIAIGQEVGRRIKNAISKSL
ncbi:MAG: phosphatase PAP2 family protein [Bacteroidetes Order II. Incertae sedis bacterium]|nr:phosphatase PAP2 family protein [Bacteroidetes Order II. bacterium]